MRHVPTLLRRELAAYFLGPMAFVILLAFQGLAWLSFSQMLAQLARSPRMFSGMADPLNFYLVGNPAFWITLMVALPALTMRLFAEERRSGTIETLFTVPVTETEVVVAKWLAGLAMYVATLVPFAVYLPFLYITARYHFDPGPLIATAIGMTTVGMMFVAVGVLFSASTRNQVVAAIWTFAFLFFAVFMTKLGYEYFQGQGSKSADAMLFLSILNQVQSFGLGQLDLRYVAVHLSVTLFALFLTTRVVRWRREG